MSDVLRQSGQIALDGGQKFAVHVVHRIAFFRDGKRDHLQRMTFKHFDQPFAPLRRGHVKAFGHARDQRILRHPVRLQRGEDGKIVVQRIDVVDNIRIERLCGDDALLRLARIEQVLLQFGDESAEDIARTEVQPDGLIGRLVAHGGNVKLRHRDACVQPRLPVADSRHVQLHAERLLTF